MTTVLVSPHISEIMLGIRFLQEQRAVWNFASGEILLGRYRHKLCSKSHRTWCRRVILQDDATIPLHSEVNLSTSLQYSNLSAVSGKGSVDWVTETRQLGPGVHVSRTVVTERSEDVPVRVANLTDGPVLIRAGTVVANLDMAEVCGADELTTLMGRCDADPVL